MHQQLFVEANPIPVKWAMARMGLCGGALRLPMTPLSPKPARPVVEAALRASGLLGLIPCSASRNLCPSADER